MSDESPAWWDVYVIYEISWWSTLSYAICLDPSAKVQGQYTWGKLLGPGCGQTNDRDRAWDVQWLFKQYFSRTFRLEILSRKGQIEWQQDSSQTWVHGPIQQCSVCVSVMWRVHSPYKVFLWNNFSPNWVVLYQQFPLVLWKKESLECRKLPGVYKAEGITGNLSASSVYWISV